MYWRLGSNRPETAGWLLVLGITKEEDFSHLTIRAKSYHAPRKKENFERRVRIVLLVRRKRFAVLLTPRIGRDLNRAPRLYERRYRSSGRYARSSRIICTDARETRDASHDWPSRLSARAYRPNGVAVLWRASGCAEKSLEDAKHVRSDILRGIKRVKKGEREERGNFRSIASPRRRWMIT